MSRYRWQATPEASDPDLLSDLELGFDDLAEAEQWLGTVYEDLRAAGVRQVVLLDEGSPILGPMDLDPEE